MGWFDRLWHATRAQLNHLARAAEDPAQLLEQATYEMEEQVLQMRQAAAQAIASQKRTERQVSQSQTLAADWQRRAHLALSHGDEALAREALGRRQAHLETARSLQDQITQQSTIVTKLKQDLRELERQVAAVKMKKDMYLARAHSAAATQRLRELLDSTTGVTIQGIFERMEERVLELEAQADLAAHGGIESQFNTLEQSQAVEAELAALKAQQAAESPPAST